MNKLEEIFFDKCNNVSHIYLVCDKNCKQCKSNGIKLIIGGSTVICGGVFGGLSCVVSFIGSFVNPILLDPYFILGMTGIGTVIGGMLGLCICINSKLVNVNKAQVKLLVEQSNRARSGLYAEKMFRYNSQMSEYYRGETKDYPVRPYY